MRAHGHSHRMPLHARLSTHRWKLTIFAAALALGGAVVIAWRAGWIAADKAFSTVHPAWIALLVALVPVALAGYVLALRVIAHLEGGPGISWRTGAEVVVAGFGPFVVGGGFSLDQRALCGLGAETADARVLVLGLGALEYAVLAPAAWVSALILLLEGADVQGAMLWSWVLAVPPGFAFGLWAAAPARRLRVRNQGHVRHWLRVALDAVAVLRLLGRHPLRHAGAWIGMAVYWAAEIAMLYASLRLFGIELDAARVIVAYATGYALTRRSMPLGGAGATEILLALGIHWVGVPLAKSLPPMVVYRAASLLLPAIPAIRSHRRLESLVGVASPPRPRAPAGAR